MSKLDQYLEAAVRKNTRRSYASAVRHFEEEWKGFLPATADSIARYLADNAALLTVSTLKQRLAALAQWHKEQGFPDPTKAPVVRKVLKGIQTLHPAVPKQAQPLQLDQLEQVVNWHDTAISLADSRGDRNGQLRYARDKALLLLGFWRGFRGDELTRAAVEFVDVAPGRGLKIFLPVSKSDRQAAGKTFKVPALTKLCPVAAYQDWISLSGLTNGPVFRGIDQFGTLSDSGLHTNSLIPLLRRMFARTGLEAPSGYSGHSLRRGFANWASSNGWDARTLMDYVGWKDAKSAIRYLDAAEFIVLPGNVGMVQADPKAIAPPLAPQVVPALPSLVPPSPACRLQVEVTCLLSRYNSQVRGLPQAHRLIEELCLAPHQMHRLDKEGRYRITVEGDSDDGIIDAIVALLDDMHRIADNHQCFLEARVHDPTGDRYWN
ncbi:site-specific integrase [Chitinimonas sp.]|uniref:site-specific integrase n=1 Tax=Chitinimonas sp. TaxID=1934313 RepID=UPI0035AF421A